MFPVTSRYYGIETAKWTAPDGREIIYLCRRFLPDGIKAVVLTEHVVTQGDRLDNITARYLGDPEQFWLICDANNTMRPEDLTAESEIGRRLPIPLPQGG
jgi:nucleoid-associated protein YgaU